MDAHIEHRGQAKDGRDTWRVKMYLGGGRYASRTIHGSRKAAEALRNEMLHEHDTGEYVSPSLLTVDAWCTEWLEACKPSVTLATHATYARQLRHLREGLGKRLLAEVTPRDVQLWQARLMTKCKSSTAWNYVSTARAVFQEAVRLSVIQRNPCQLVKKPQRLRRPVGCWTAEQTMAFLRALEGNDYRAFFATTIYTGLRAGEAIGLRWEDYDVDAGLLRVNRTWSDAEQKMREGIAKSQSSLRTISIGPELRTILAAERKRQVERRLLLGPRYKDPGIMCPTASGTLATSHTLRSERMARICRQAGVPVIRFHDLRHTHASLMLAQGVPVKVVSERLGHATTRMTLETYAHVLPGMQKEAAEQFDALLRGATSRGRL